MNATTHDDLYQFTTKKISVYLKSNYIGIVSIFFGAEMRMVRKPS